MKKVFYVISVLLFCVNISAHAGTVSLQPGEILRLRALVVTNADAAKQFSLVHRAADTALGEAPNPIEKIISEGHLDKDPLKIQTEKSLADMDKIESLAWAWAVTNDSRYSAKVREFILAWAKVNHSDGDSINETKFEQLIVAYDLLRDTFSPTDRELVDDWLREKANTLWKDHRGLKENWFSHRLKIVGLIGWTIHDGNLVTETIEGFHRQINTNFKPDGASTDFYLRDAFHYHLYDVEPLLTLARAGERNGEKFYEFAATNGATLDRGVAFVVPYALGQKTHEEFVNSKVPFDRKRAENGQGEYQPHVWNPRESIHMFSQAAWFRPEYGALAEQLAGQPDKAFFNWQMVLNAVTRPPAELKP
jgi:hypothetical protein